MEQRHRKWDKKFQGNLRLLHDVKSPLRYYVEQQIKHINLKEFPNRPTHPVDLSIGDPTKSQEFRTNLQNIEIIAKNVGKHDGYTDFIGSEEARQCVAKKFQAPNYQVGKENVFLTTGGGWAIWAVIMLLADQGDNFLFPSPGFPLAGTIADAIGVNIRLYHLKPEDWSVDMQEFKSLIDNRTKFILINDPSNPLGSCWSEEQKLQIIQVARSRNIPILADEIYETITYGQPSKTFAELATEQVTILKCSGLSKKWLGPGWRFGWLIIYAKEQIARQYQGPLRNIFKIMLMPNTIMQSSLKQIIENPVNDEYMKEKLKIMERNQQILSENLGSKSYCSIGNASGALYATILLKLEDFNKQSIPNIIDFCKKLYAEENVMIFPGEFFYSSETFLRLTISCSTSIIEEFVIRFKRFCEKNLKTPK